MTVKLKKYFHKEEDKYNIISAMIKSIRGSDPDAALYWLGRLLYGGEDPRYIARRLLIQASEDIGMANPEALLIADAAYNASEKIGMPEIRIILAHAVVYLAISTKSNSCYNGINAVLSDIKMETLKKYRFIYLTLQGDIYTRTIIREILLIRLTEKK